MSILYKNISTILDEKKITRHKLAVITNYDAGSLNKMIKGQNKFPDELISKIAPVLDVAEDDLKSWILADKYPKSVIENAYNCKSAKKKKRELVITNKIDDILIEKNLSRTQLAKQINYSQSGLNAMITGKKSFSKNVMQKVADVLEISPENIQAWILADKEEIQTLQKAIEVFEK